MHADSEHAAAAECIAFNSSGLLHVLYMGSGLQPEIQSEYDHEGGGLRICSAALLMA